MTTCGKSAGCANSGERSQSGTPYSQQHSAESNANVKQQHSRKGAVGTGCFTVLFHLPSTDQAYGSMQSTSTDLACGAMPYPSADLGYDPTRWMNLKMGTLLPPLPPLHTLPRYLPMHTPPLSPYALPPTIPLHTRPRYRLRTRCAICSVLT